MGKLERTNVVLEMIHEDEDLEEFYQIAQDSGVQEYVGFMYPTDRMQAREILDFLADQRLICFKIVEVGTYNMVGIILGDPLTSTMIDISYFVGADYRGQGYCSSAVRQFEDYLREDTYFKYMRFFVKEDNAESQGVMNRLGIQRKFGNIYMLDLE